MHIQFLYTHACVSIVCRMYTCTITTVLVRFVSAGPKGVSDLWKTLRNNPHNLAAPETSALSADSCHRCRQGADASSPYFEPVAK